MNMRMASRARLALPRRDAATQNDAKTLMALGEIHRAAGRLTRACGLYSQAAKLGGQLAAPAAWRYALLAGARLPHAPQGGSWPAPFVRFADFLPAADHQRMLAAALAARPAWRPARVFRDGVGRVVPDERLGLEVAPWPVEEFRRLLVPRVLRALPVARRQLRMDPVEIGAIGSQLNVYPDGGFSRPHYDQQWHMAYARQRLTAIYFLHTAPRAFTGGDLLLHDTAVRDSKPFGSPGLYTRLEPASNTLLFFLPACYHSITPVVAPAEDLAASRFSVLCRLTSLRDDMRDAAKLDAFPRRHRIDRAAGESQDARLLEDVYP